MQKMINFDVIKENIKEQSKSTTKFSSSIQNINNWSLWIWNLIINLINQQPDIDKIYYKFSIFNYQKSVNTRMI